MQCITGWGGGHFVEVETGGKTGKQEMLCGHLGHTHCMNVCGSVIDEETSLLLFLF